MKYSLEDGLGEIISEILYVWIDRQIAVDGEVDDKPQDGTVGAGNNKTNVAK